MASPEISNVGSFPDFSQWGFLSDGDIMKSFLFLIEKNPSNHNSQTPTTIDQNLIFISLTTVLNVLC